MSEDRSVRVLIVEDEPLGAARLVDLLGAQQGAWVLGVAENCPEAIAAIRASEPDLVFLDIQMPGGSGIDVVKAIGPEAMPATVFVTAYDQYAIDAFRLAAVDYLLKPYSDERFVEAFERATHRLRLEKLAESGSQLRKLVDQQGLKEEAQTQAVERLAVQSRGKMRVIPTSSIRFIRASGVYANIHTDDDVHLMRESLTVLEERLDPSEFFRIHRSTIVRLDQIELLLRNSGGRYEVQLGSGKKLRVGRSRLADLEERLGRRQKPAETPG